MLQQRPELLPEPGLDLLGIVAEVLVGEEAEAAAVGVQPVAQRDGGLGR